MTGGRLQRVAVLRRRRGPSASPTATASPTSTSRALIELPPRAGHARDGHRRAAARALRRAGHRGRPRHAASTRSRTATAAGSTAASSCSTPGSALHRRRRTDLGARAAGAPGRATASSSPTATTASGSRWTRCATSDQLEELWDVGQRAVEALGVSARRFWRGRRVLVTGHTGFKGTWLSLWLQPLGAEVDRLLARAPPTEPSLFELARVGEAHARLRRRRARRRRRCARAIAERAPEVVLPPRRAAARAPLVRATRSRPSRST